MDITEKKLEQLLKENNKVVIDDVGGVLRDFMGQVDARFDGVDKRFDGVDARFDRLEKRLESVEQEIVELKESHNRLLNTIDGFVKRLEEYEVESRARDHEMARITRWIEQIAAKTGVKLEY